jgi:hypothetical protein
MKRMFFKDEKGIALIAAAGTIVVLIAIGFGLIVFVENMLQKVSEYRQYQKALNLADAGVDHVTWLYKTKSIAPEMEDHVFTIDFGNEGQCKYKIAAGSIGFEKVVYSVGITPRGYKKAIRVVLFSMNIWDLLLSAGSQNPDRRPGGSGGIEGNGAVVGPLYVRGGLPNLSGTFDIYEGPLFIKNGVLVKQSSAGNVGTSSEPIRAYIDGNEYGAVFKRSGNSLVAVDPWSPSLNIYISNLSRKVPDIEFPALTPEELQRLYNLAKNEGTDNRVPSYPSEATNISFDESSIISFPGQESYKVVDNDLIVNKSVGTYTLSDQIFGFVDSNMNGQPDDEQYYEFAFNGLTNPKRLIIRGTVFIDGNLVLQGPIIYTGKGTLVVNGDITIKGSLLASSDYPAINAMGLAIKGNTYINANSANDDIDDIQIALYAERDVVYQGNNTRYYGALIAGFIDMTSAQNIKLVLADALPGNLPPSLPASEANIVTIAGWKEIPVPEGF